ncbi:MAG: alpha/beta hydrolase [Candidatus Aminicenantes bacterium]|nr:alpha/beta hydrolase [Candidatus Aminicenantes bacterium]
MKGWFGIVLFASCLLLSTGGIFSPALQEDSSRDINLTTEDNVNLVGTYYAPRKGDSPALLLVHGMNRTRLDWVGLARLLQANGYGVLTIDLRGHGDSMQQGDRLIRWVSFSDEDFRRMLMDIASGIQFLKSRAEIDPYMIGIVGTEMGANLALNYASQNRQIGAVVLISPGLNYRGVSCVGAITSYRMRPVLLIASEEDVYSAFSANELYSLAQGIKDLKTYRNAGHGNRLLWKEEGAGGMIMEWLKIHLPGKNAEKEELREENPHKRQP